MLVCDLDNTLVFAQSVAAYKHERFARPRLSEFLRSAQNSFKYALALALSRARALSLSLSVFPYRLYIIRLYCLQSRSVYNGRREPRPAIAGSDPWKGHLLVGDLP